MAGLARPPAPLLRFDIDCALRDFDLTSSHSWLRACAELVGRGVTGPGGEPGVEYREGNGSGARGRSNDAYPNDGEAKVDSLGGIVSPTSSSRASQEL